jgi:hypothetical protein
MTLKQWRELHRKFRDSRRQWSGRNIDENAPATQEKVRPQLSAVQPPSPPRASTQLRRMSTDIRQLRTPTDRGSLIFADAAPAGSAEVETAPSVALDHTFFDEARESVVQLIKEGARRRSARMAARHADTAAHVGRRLQAFPVQ